LAALVTQVGGRLPLRDERTLPRPVQDRNALIYFLLVHVQLLCDHLLYCGWSGGQGGTTGIGQSEGVATLHFDKLAPD
jgi:hypothetical protein